MSIKSLKEWEDVRDLLSDDLITEDVLDEIITRFVFINVNIYCVYKYVYMYMYIYMHKYINVFIYMYKIFIYRVSAGKKDLDFDQFFKIVSELDELAEEADEDEDFNGEEVL
jgi:hypothetical protein